MDEKHIKVNAEMYRRWGEWCILISGPKWLIMDFAQQATYPRESGKPKIIVHNYGGGGRPEEYSFLLGTYIPPEPDKISLFSKVKQKFKRGFRIIIEEL